MRMVKNKHVFVFLLAVFANFMQIRPAFAIIVHVPKSTWAKHELKQAKQNAEVLINGNNPFQLLNLRTSRPGHFIKVFLIELLSFFVCLKYLKNRLKEIHGEYVSFLKRLLFPKHVFW